MPEKNHLTSRKAELEHSHVRQNAQALLAQLKFNHVFASCREALTWASVKSVSATKS